MLYVFYGTDRMAVRRTSERLVASLAERFKTLTIDRLDAVSCERGQITGLAGASSLFGGVNVYVIDSPSESEEVFSEIMREAIVLAASPNHFVIIDGALSAAQRKVLKASAVTIEEFKAGTVERFNTFSLVDALVRKDKRQLWLLLQEAKRDGAKSEEIIGILWWQLKLLRLAAVTKTANEAGVSEFPYNKAKRALPLFSAGEIDRLAETLLTLYHDGHVGKREIDLALEEWVLRG